MGNKSKKKLYTGINALIQTLLVVATFIPFYFMLISSFKNNAEISANYFGITAPIRWTNYVHAFKRVIHYLLNTLFVCGVAVIGVTILSCLASYIFARYKFPGKNFLYYFYISFLMIPGVLTLIPQFVLVVRFKLIGTHFATILPYIAFGQIMFTFVLRTFIEEIPKELFDSATVDGASPFRMFVHIVIPLAKPVITSMALMNLLNNWNDFIWPLLVSSSEEMKTITVGLYAFTDAQQTQYGILFAGFIIASLPLVLLFSFNMKYFVQGITAGAIKG